MSQTKVQLRAKAKQALETDRKYKHRSLQSIMKSLGWLEFKNLPSAEQAQYIVAAKARLEKADTRIRDQEGRYAEKELVEVPKENDVSLEVMAMAYKFKEGKKAKVLHAKVGKAFMKAVSEGTGLPKAWERKRLGPYCIA